MLLSQYSGHSHLLLCAEMAENGPPDLETVLFCSIALAFIAGLRKFGFQVAGFLRSMRRWSFELR